MKKSVGKKEVSCGNHEFSLIPLRSDLYFKSQICLSFCDPKAHPKKRGKIFNRDGSYATNTFILPDEKVVLILLSKTIWKTR
jgi:hypothetical protein